MPSDREAVTAVFGRLRAVCDEVAGLSLEPMTAPELLGMLDALETVRRRRSGAADLDDRRTGELGQHNGLPATIIVSTTLACARPVPRDAGRRVRLVT
ncbi:MAG: hypothetical protein QOD39_1976 [Mycobacterium sp.]|nr:hypothetical protein [Mycobacterium sp.]